MSRVYLCLLLSPYRENCYLQVLRYTEALNTYLGLYVLSKELFAQPRSQGPLSSSLEKVPWLQLFTCLLDFCRFQRSD